MNTNTVNTTQASKFPGFPFHEHAIAYTNNFFKERLMGYHPEEKSGPSNTTTCGNDEDELSRTIKKYNDARLPVSTEDMLTVLFMWASSEGVVSPELERILMKTIPDIIPEVKVVAKEGGKVRDNSAVRLGTALTQIAYSISSNGDVDPVGSEIARLINKEVSSNTQSKTSSDPTTKVTKETLKVGKSKDK